MKDWIYPIIAIILMYFINKPSDRFSWIFFLIIIVLVIITNIQRIKNKDKPSDENDNPFGNNTF